MATVVVVVVAVLLRWCGVGGGFRHDCRYGATKSIEGLLCRDENCVTVPHSAITLAKTLKHHRVCTFNFTSFTDPIVQFM